MKTTWVAGLSPQEKEEITLAFQASGRFRERLNTLLLDKVEGSRKEARNVEGYEKASWPYFQADKMGYERALFEVISLISSKSAEK